LGVRKGYQSLVIFAVLMVGLLVGATAMAQSPVAPATTSTTASDPSQTDQDLAWLIAILQDDNRRAALLDQLKARNVSTAPVASTQQEETNEPEAASLVEALSQQVSDFSERALRFTASLGQLPHVISGIVDQFNDPGIRAARLNALARAIGALAVGLIIEWLVVRSFSGLEGRFETSKPSAMLGQTVALLARAVLDAIPVAAFIGATLLTLRLLQSSHRAELATILFIYAHVAVRSALILARFLVAPGTSNLRLFALTEETAQYLYIWIRRLAMVAVYGVFLTQAVRFFGVAADTRLALTKSIGTVVALLLLVFVLQNRANVARLIANESGGPLFGIRKALADVWHILAIVYLAGLFGVWLFDVRGGFEYLGRGSLGTVVIFIVAWLLISAMKRIVSRSFQIGTDLTQRFPGLETRANRYLPIFREVLRGLIWAFALLLILQVWGVRSLQWLNSDTGVRVVGTVIAIGLVLLVALLIWEGFAMALERYAARLVTRGSSGARARTLLPLFRTTAFIVLAVMSGLIVLTQVGVDITPLLAGAGVVGLAVGFGSQKLVQDVITGIFILIEDTIAVGDTVDLGGGHVGVVEGISIRTIRLRDGNGGVHTVPFSAVTTVNNQTRDFAKGLFEVEVAYKEDIERVIPAMQEVGDAISKDKAFASVILEPFSIIGVDKVKGSGVVVLAQITTLPGKQWDVTRAFNRALKHKFDELDIQMPSGRTTVYVQGPGSEKKDEAGDTDAGKKPAST
jgi:small conductance mechanosensitive channel